MERIEDLHQRAMNLAELAHIERIKKNNSYRADTYLRQAFDLERKAALEAKELSDYEPSRSILMRSAASLALECGEIREAERLISLALSGNPPEQIANELRDLLEQVYFSRHLETRGITLNDDEFQLALAGNAVSFGIIQSSYFLNRLNSTSRLIYRTAERLSGRSYRDDGKVDKVIKESFDTFISVPRAASFAVTIKIGRPTRQLDAFNEKPRLVEEILTCFELYENNALDELHSHIIDEPYFNNFVSLSKQISPDGENISFVGFTAKVNNQEKKVHLTRNKRSIKEELVQGLESESRINEPVVISGRLLYADNTRNKREIRLVDEQERSFKIKVPKGLMDDIVKPLWDEDVIVKGIQKTKTIIELKEIEKAEG